MNLKSLKLLAITAFCTATALFAQTTTPPTTPPSPKPWAPEFMSTLFSELGHQWNNAGDKFTSTLFKSITERDLFKTDLAAGEISLKVKREVYDNKDILESWTVVDIFNIPLSYNLPIMDWVDIGTGPFSIGLGLTFEVLALNIRQVRPGDILLLTPAAKLKEEINQSITSIDNESDVNEDDITVTESEGIIPWSRMSPLVMARYSKLLNLLTHPLRLPLTAKKAIKMNKDEISSWFVSGTIQLGASVGWNFVNPTGIGNAELGLGVSTFLNGRYQFSTHKEKDDQILLKVTRATSKGRNIVFGNAEIEKEVFSGFVIADKKVFGINATIVPFQVLVHHQKTHQFDVAYRYDLTKIEARKAYSHAVLGRLALSEQLSKEEGSGVTWAFDRDSDIVTRSRNHKTNLSLIFQKGASNSIKLSQALVTMPDGKREIFKAYASSTRGFRTLWGSLEGKRYSFDVTRDSDESRQLGDEGLIVEGQFNDNRTDARELIDFMTEVEEAVGIRGMFPRPELYEPSSVCSPNEENCAPRLMKYGRTSFYYKVYFNQKQIDTLKKIDEDDLWPHLEVAFGIKPGNWSKKYKRWLSGIWRSPLTLTNLPLNLFDLHMKEGSKLILAQRIVRDWRKWRKETELKEQTYALGELLRSQYYGREMVRLVRSLLQGDSIPYFVSAHASELFGSIVKSSDQLPPDHDADPHGDVIDFDRIGPRISFDPHAKITDFDIEYLRGEVKIRFVIPKETKALYWRADKIRGWLGAKKLIKLITPMGQDFRPGLNVITLKEGQDNGALNSLAEQIFAHKEIRFMMSISLEKGRWGELITKDIRRR